MRFIAILLINVSIFVILYDPRFISIGFGVTKLVTVLMFLCCVIIMTKKSIFTVVNKKIFFCFISFGFIFSLLQWIAYVKGGDGFLYNSMKSVFSFHIPVAIMCSYLLGFVKLNYQSLFEMIAVLCFLQSCFIFIDWVFSGGMAMNQSIFSSILLQPVSTENSYRVSGFSSLAGDGLSFVQYIGVITSFFISNIIANNYRKRKIYGLMCFWTFFTLILVGRTGIILSIIFIILYSFYVRGASKVISIVFKFILTFSLITAVGYFFIKESYYDQVMLQVIPHAFEFFYNFTLTGEFYTKSTDVIFNDMVVLPEKFSTWIIGDGFWSNPNGEGNYIPSDIGFIRVLFYSGLLGSLLLYTWFLFCYALIRQRFNDYKFRRFIDCYIITLFIGHIKFPFIFSSISLFLIFFLMTAIPTRKYYLVGER
jgi:hypothetical protein